MQNNKGYQLQVARIIKGMFFQTKNIQAYVFCYARIIKGTFLGPSRTIDSQGFSTRVAQNVYPPTWDIKTHVM